MNWAVLVVVRLGDEAFFRLCEGWEVARNRSGRCFRSLGIGYSLLQDNSGVDLEIALDLIPKNRSNRSHQFILVFWKVKNILPESTVNEIVRLLRQMV